MSYKVVCDACLEAVGQGCFYTARICFGGAEPFSLVYDCGSLSESPNPPSPLSAAVDAFHAGLGNREIDMLVLSHLDADHVNGLPELLKPNGCGVKHVFLPYLSPLERVLVAVSFNSEDPAYYQFLAAPDVWLREHGAGQVTFVGSGGEPGENQAASDGNSPAPSPERFRETKLLVPPTPLGPLADALNSEMPEKTGAPSTNATMGDRADVELFPLWIFRFFQKEGLRDVIEAVRVNRATRPGNTKKSDWDRCKAFIEAVEKVVPDLDPQKLIAAIKDEADRAKLKKAYDKITKVHNEVSLCLWHGPRKYSDVEVACKGSGLPALYWDPYWPRHRWWPHHRDGGTMLTGDIKLKSALHPDFCCHFNQQLAQTAVFQLPHHGSRHNWEADPALLASDPTMMVSAGIGNTFGHPGQYVVEELAYEYDLPVVLSNQRHGFNYKVEVKK